VIAGEAAGLVHDIPSAAEVIERRVRTATGLLRDGARLCGEDARAAGYGQAHGSFC